MNAAAWMLAELHSPVTPGMSPQMSPSMSPWASPLGSPLGSPHISPARSHLPPSLSSPRPHNLATIAELAGQKPRPVSTPKQRAQASWDRGRPAHSSHSSSKAEKPHARSTSVQSPVSAASDTSRQKQESKEEAGDAYHSFRGEALQLTRRWQRAAHKATSAFSGSAKCLPVMLKLCIQLVLHIKTCTSFLLHTIPAHWVLHSLIQGCAQLIQIMCMGSAWTQLSLLPAGAVSLWLARSECLGGVGKGTYNVCTDRQGTNLQMHMA